MKYSPCTLLISAIREYSCRVQYLYIYPAVTILLTFHNNDNALEYILRQDVKNIRVKTVDPDSEKKEFDCERIIVY